MDPCEAAVDENLTYQNWGKKQTYILGFYVPLLLETISNGDADSAVSPDGFPYIEDVTQSYTTDTWEEICKRRRQDRSDGGSDGGEDGERRQLQQPERQRPEQNECDVNNDDDHVQLCVERAIAELKDKLRLQAAGGADSATAATSTATENAPRL